MVVKDSIQAFEFEEVPGLPGSIAIVEHDCIVRVVCW